MVNAVGSAQVTTTLTTSSSSQPSDILIAESFINGSKEYGKYTEKQISNSWDKVNAKEFAAFGYLANDATMPGIKKFTEAYIKYIDQMSPDEQNSVRYKGTKESMTGLLAQVNGQITNETSTGKKSKKAISELEKMFDDMKIRFKKQIKHTSKTKGTTRMNDQVTISEEANRYAASLQATDNTEI